MAMATDSRRYNRRYNRHYNRRYSRRYSRRCGRPVLVVMFSLKPFPCPTVLQLLPVEDAHNGV